MGSYRVVGVVGAIAALLWAVVVVSADGGQQRSDIRVPLTAVSPDQIATISVRDGERIARMTRSDGDVFVVGGIIANPDLVSGMTATLQFGFSRRLEPGKGRDSDLGLGATADAVEVEVMTTSGESIKLRRGARVAGDSLVWIGRDSDALLLTQTEADLLFVDPDALVDRRVFRLDDQPITELVARRGDGKALHLRGKPLGLAVDDGIARISKESVRQLVSPLRELEVEVEATGEPRSAGVFIELKAGALGAQLNVIGQCSGGRLRVESGALSGCVPAAPLEAITAAVSQPESLLTGLVDDDRSALRAKLRVGSRIVEIDRKGDGAAAANDWFAAFSSPRARAVLEGTVTPIGAVEVEYESAGGDRELETVRLVRDAAGLVGQVLGQPTAWRFEPEKAEIVLGARAFQFRRRDLSSRDPSEIATVTIGSRKLEGPKLPAETRASLAHLEAVQFVAAAAERVHRLDPPKRRVTLRFTPPPIATGDPDEVVIELGARTDDGCYGRLQGDPAVFVLDKDTCATLFAL